MPTPVSAAGFIAACTAILLAPPAAAQQPVGPANPAVDSVFAQFDSPASPGCALGVYRGGRIVYTRGYGMADLERRVPITPASVFDLGSTSKQFTATAIVLLAQDGKLSLDDDVRRHVPELPEYQRPITIRHLLHHTSGLRDYIGLLTLGGSRIDDVTTPDDALAAIARQKSLNFAPGDEHLYSNSGYFLLSLIAERVSGQPYAAFIRERVFAPLGMTHTHVLGSYDDIVPDRALAYSPRPGGGLRTDMPRWLQLGDGAVFSTVEDLFRWNQNFSAPTVGGPALLEALHTAGRLTNGRTLPYALGLVVDSVRGIREVSHGGAWGGYRAELLRYPDHDLAVATLCNLGTSNPSALARRVAGVYLADVFAAAPAPPGFVRAGSAPGGMASPPASRPTAPELMAALAGSYQDTLTRIVRTIVADSGRLQLVGGQRVNLRRIGDDSAFDFMLEGPPLRLSFAQPIDGRAPSLRTVQGSDTMFLRRVELARPSATELAAYAGTYYGAEVDALFRVTVEDGALVIHRPAAAPSRLTPTTRDEFALGSVTVQFSRDGAGTVRGFVLNVGRVRNLEFVRRE